MNDQSQSCKPKISRAKRVTFSQASAVGITLYVSPVGLSIDQCGPVLVHANHSVAPAPCAEPTTNATCGRTSTDSFGNVDLTSCLVNKLRTRLNSAGSIEYAQTWKERVTELGRSYWVHIPSGRRTNGNDSTGWLTPRAKGDAGGTRFEKGDYRNLEDQVKAAAWGTPTCTNAMQPTDERIRRIATGETTRKVMTGGEPKNLHEQCHLVGWVTPTAQDANRGVLPPRPTDTGIPLTQQAALIDASSGIDSNSLTAPTAKRGGLNPAFSLWLMGFPSDWLMAAPSKASAAQQH